MFEPSTYWEKRISALETLVLNLCKVAGMMGLVGAWHHQIEVLKSKLVEERLGPVTVDENSATGKYVFDVAREQMLLHGLLLDLASYTDGNLAQLHLRQRALRLQELPDLEDAMGPTISSGLFRLDINVGEQEAEFAPVLVVRDGELINLFVFSDESMSPLSLCLDMMPADFDWNNANHRHAWRSETFAYRDQLTKIGFDITCQGTFNAVDWDAIAAKVASIEPIDAPPPANDELVSANDDSIEAAAPSDDAPQSG